jgi:hypothetical protein
MKRRRPYFLWNRSRTTAVCIVEQTKHGPRYYATIGPRGLAQVQPYVARLGIVKRLAREGRLTIMRRDPYAR